MPAAHIRLAPDASPGPSTLAVITIGALLVERAFVLGPPGTRARVQLAERPVSDGSRPTLDVALELPEDASRHDRTLLKIGLQAYLAECAARDRAAIDLDIRYRSPGSSTDQLTA